MLGLREEEGELASVASTASPWTCHARWTSCSLCACSSVARPRPSLSQMASCWFSPILRVPLRLRDSLRRSDSLMGCVLIQA